MIVYSLNGKNIYTVYCTEIIMVSYLKYVTILKTTTLHLYLTNIPLVNMQLHSTNMFVCLHVY